MKSVKKLSFVKKMFLQMTLKIKMEYTGVKVVYKKSEGVLIRVES